VWLSRVRVLLSRVRVPLSRVHLPLCRLRRPPLHATRSSLNFAHGDGECGQVGDLYASEELAAVPEVPDEV